MKLILALLLALVVQFTFAQEKTISGVVSDEMGPIADISVKVLGTNQGTVTDFDGNYAIKANTGATLVFSHISYGEVSKKVGASNKIDVTMNAAGNVLDAVIVTGFGNKTKDKMTSAVSVISAKELIKLSPTTTLDNMLQGKATGVNVTASNGKPGKAAFVRIRGVGSLSADQDPLYIVDGIANENINSVSPSDIESMTILKDAATASLYGSRGSNGVIVITTKKGRRNRKGTISVTSTVGYGRKIRDPFRMMNTTEKLQYEAEMASLGLTNGLTLPGVTSSASEISHLQSLDHDWQDTLLRRSYTQSNNISFTGGTEKISYFMSLGHDVNTGIIKTINGYERINGRFKVGFEVNDKLTITPSFAVTTTTMDDPRDRNNVQNPFRAMYDYNPYAPLYLTDSNGDFILDANGNKEYNLTTKGFSISEALVNNTEKLNRLFLTGGIKTVLKLNDKLTNSLNIGGSDRIYRREYFMKPGSVLDGYVGDPNAPGSKTDNGSNTFDYTVTNVLKYNSYIGDHSFSVSGLFEFNKNRRTTYSLSSKGFTNSGLPAQSNAATATAASSNLYENAMVSFGGFLDYDYSGKYIVTASIRRDGASQFGANYRYGNFWSVSGAWNIHNEDFLKDSFLDVLKLRGSYGTTGNNNIGRYASIPTITLGSLNGESIAFPGYAGNPNLRWEKQAMYDVGLEFQFLDKKIRGVADYYNRTSQDLLLNAPLSTLIGDNVASVSQNVGEMVNKGLEFELTGTIVDKNDYFLEIGANFSILDNKITKLVGNAEFPDGATIARDGSTVLEVGETFNTFKLVRWAGVNPANGEPLFYDKDGNVTTVHNSANEVILSGKSTVAKHEGGINLFTSYKGFDLSANLYYKAGHYVNNFMMSNMLSDGTSVDDNQRVDAFNYWKNPGDVDVLPNPLYGNTAQLSSDRFLQKADYLRLRNVSIGYTLPNKYSDRLKIKTIRFYVQAQNIWTWAPYFSGDPEVGIGSEETTNNAGFGAYNLYSYPQVQSVLMGLNFKF